MACPDCNNEKVDCGCVQEALSINQICNPVQCDTEECSESFSAQCILYTGDDIVCNNTTLITAGDNLAQAVANVAAFFCTQDGVDADIICGEDTVVAAGTTVNDALDQIVAYFCGVINALTLIVTQNTSGLLNNVQVNTLCVANPTTGCDDCTTTLTFFDNGANQIDQAQWTFEQCGPAQNLYNADGTIQDLTRIITMNGSTIGFVTNDTGSPVAMFTLQDQGAAHFVKIGDVALLNTLTFEVYGLTKFYELINITDANGPNLISFSDFVTSNELFFQKESLTANHTQTYQNKTGTIALLSDIVTPSVYGLFTQIGNSIPVTVSGTGSLIGPGAGTLLVPANTFNLADSFRLSMHGHVSCDPNQDINITVRSTGLSPVVLAQTGIVTLPAISDEHFEVKIDFTIRALGDLVGPAFGSVGSAGQFTYTKTASGGFDGTGFSQVVNLDTTVDNTLSIEIEWLTSSAGNSIYTEMLTLTKMF